MILVVPRRATNGRDKVTCTLLHLVRPDQDRMQLRSQQHYPGAGEAPAVPGGESNPSQAARLSAKRHRELACQGRRGGLAADLDLPPRSIGFTMY